MALHVGMLRAIAALDDDLLPRWKPLIDEIEGQHYNQLRFEETMGLVAQYDAKLEVLTALFAHSAPNFYHYFFAQMLSLGAPVLTTNFDSLIEQAAKNAGYPIKCLASAEDFWQFSATPTPPTELLKHANELPAEVRQWLLDHAAEKAREQEDTTAPLLKLHGSARGLSGEDTTETIRTTVAQICGGRGTLLGDGLTCERLLKGRPLIVVGYSGSDDFDVLPLIRQCTTTEPIFWIFHSPEHDDVIPVPQGGLLGTFDRSLSRVASFFAASAGGPRYILRTDSATALGRLLAAPFAVPTHSRESPLDLSGYLAAWARRVFPERIWRFDLCARALLQRRHWKESQRVWQALLEIRDASLSAQQRAAVHNSLGVILQQLQQLTEALEAFDESAGLYREIGRYGDAASADANRAQVLVTTNELEDALRLCRRSYYTFQALKREGDAALARYTSSTIARARGQIDVEVANLKVALRGARRGGEPTVEYLALQRLRELNVPITSNEFGFDDDGSMGDLGRALQPRFT
jgi:tetratricopeptide (TPR) repeat protein